MKTPRLLDYYQKEITPQLKKAWKLKNERAVPEVVKVVVSSGITDEQHRDEALKNMGQQIAAITGQRPIVTKAKQSIAGFKLRTGDPVGLKVNLRRQRMYEFLDKLINIVLPRVKDFQGIRRTGFDNQGNYTLGLTEQIVFPEVDYDTIDKVRGLEITLVVNTKDKKQALRLLELLGMPFEKKPNG